MTVEERRTFPAGAELLEIHARLCAGDPLATADLAEALLEPLARSLLRAFPRVAEDDCYTAAEDALLALFARPDAYRQERGPLDGYLRMAARRDLQNLQRAGRRHSSRRADWGAVELSVDGREHLMDRDADPAMIVELQEQIEQATQQRLAVPDDVAFSPEEHAVLRLMQAGERRTGVFARALAIDHLPAPEQRAEVKRVKDRVKVRLRRAEAIDD